MPGEREQLGNWAIGMDILQPLKKAKRCCDFVGQLGKDYCVHRRMTHSDFGLFWRRYMDQSVFLFSNAITAEDYYKFGFHDGSLPRARKAQYLGSFQDWRLFRAMNSDREGCRLLDDKLSFCSAAADPALRLPMTLAVISTGKGRNFESMLKVIASRDEFLKWLDQSRLENFVLKPMDGIKGTGIKSLCRKNAQEDAWTELPSGAPITAHALWTFCESFLSRTAMIVQERLIPHPEMQKIMPNVLHTVRMVTYASDDFHLIDAVLRVGRGQGPADNLAKGGIMVPVDVATGICGEPSMIVDGAPQAIERHPITGRQITNTQLPDWQLACAMALRAAQVFSSHKSVGWDIALTSDGPVLLEGNWHYDLGVNQIAHRKGILALPWKKLFFAQRGFEHIGHGLKKVHSNP